MNNILASISGLLPMLLTLAVVIGVLVAVNRLLNRARSRDSENDFRNKLIMLGLSLAGLVRLGLQPPGAIPLPAETMLSAAAQGTIAIQVRENDTATRECVETIHHAATQVVTDTERLLLHHLEGGCRIPLGALAELEGNTLTLRGRLTSPDGKTVFESRAQADAKDWRELAGQVAEKLRANGGSELLEMVRGL